MGAVYKARQPALDRLVALKILPVMDAGGANFEERFNREARALARLNHPNIVTVHEFGQVGGWHYFIMEFVDGANLRQLEKAGRLAPRETLQIVPQICDALQYAHDEGVVHRDIKPENVLVDRKGRVKIADFGLAKILGQEPEALRLTREGQVMGTPHYMAPEQLERPLTVDHRADISSLGVVLYEMLTGDLPLGKFSPPSRKVQVDVRLDDVVLRALENDPDRRYQHASEIKSGVETVSGAPETPPTPVTSEPRDPEARYLGWLGFRVVRDDGGRRAVYWKGALLALAVVFGLVSIPFAFVSAFTKDSFLGWIGIVGWPSVLARLLISVAITASGVRATLRSTLTPEPLPDKLRGTVLLPSARDGWLIGRRLVAVSLLALAWCAFQVQWLTPRLSPPAGAPASAEVARVNLETGALAARLPGGGLAELLAIGEPDAVPNGWWTPDGTPVKGTTFGVQDICEIRDDPAERQKDMVFRFSSLPEGVTGPLFQLDPPAASGAGGGTVQDGGELVGAWPIRVAWPREIKTCKVRVGFGLAGWQIVARHEPLSRSGSLARTRGKPDWAIVFHGAASSAEGTQATYVFGEDDRNWKRRVVAIDHKGGEHPHTSESSSQTGTSSVWTFNFHSIAPHSIRELQVQMRPLHWVEFRNLALDPNTPVPAPAHPRFSPATNITFTGVLDLNTGRVGSLPEDKSNLPDGASPVQKNLWMRRNNFDVEARLRTLGLAGTKIVYLDAHHWDDLTPGRLGFLIRDGGAIPTELQPPFKGLPVTVGFRTPANTTGILQILSYGNDGASPTMRLKRVLPANSGRGQASVTQEPPALREEKARLAALRVDLGDSHPDVQKSLARIAELERLSREEPNASADLREAKAHLAELKVLYGQAHPEIQQALARIKALEGK